MSYLALYRKYRSKNFDELVGQEAIKQTLENSLKIQKISHAYLFSGPRGTGKTSVARLFAKALNCEKGNGEICNECSNCRAINEGSHPDVIEIDAASNSGVDEVRELIEKVKYAPIQGKYKVYIIDEVHMMTNSAFNALLKTLEEPPSYVVFILCTTEPYKLLPTILSRCQRYEFKKITDAELKKLITHVLKEEGVSATNDAINLIVELANGGARDSLSLLDQVISYAGSNIEEEDVIKMFGLVSSQDKIRLLENIKDGNTLKVLKTYDEFVIRNIDLSRLVNELLTLLKDSLVYLKTRDKSLITSSKEEDAKEIMLKFDESELLSYIDLLLKCQNEFKTTSDPNFLFEIYLLKLLKVGTSQEVTVQKVETPIKKPVVTAPIPQEETPVSTNNTVKTQDFIKNNAVPEEKVNEVKPVASLKLKPSNTEFAVLETEGDIRQITMDELIKLTIISNRDERKMLSERWNALEQLINDPNEGPYASLLLDSRPYIVTNSNLILICDYKNTAKKINIISNQEGLNKLVKKVLGRKVCLYALNRDESTELIKKYRNLQELNHLPKKTEIEDNKLF